MAEQTPIMKPQVWCRIRLAGEPPSPTLAKQIGPFVACPQAGDVVVLHGPDDDELLTEVAYVEWSTGEPTPVLWLRRG